MSESSKNLRGKLVIDAKHKVSGYSIRALFRYRELLLMLAYRDLKIRYAQTFIGFSWTLLRPLISLLIFTFVFGMAIKVPVGEIPYPLFVLVGIQTWGFFNYVVSNAAVSISDNEPIITKIYFPRVILPLSKVPVAGLDLLINFLLLGLFMLFWGQMPTWQIVYLPIFIILLIINSFGVGIWLCALSIRFRDFKQVSIFFLQLGTYISPVVYPASLIPEKYQIIYFLNPMSGVIEGFRWCLLGSELTLYVHISYSLGILITLSGFYYFKSLENYMVDLL